MKWICRLLILASLGPSLVAQADDQTAKTTTKRIEDPRLPSGFVSSVDLSQQVGLDNGLAERVAQMPGVTVRQQSTTGQPAYIQVRGGQPRQLVVLLNGLRIKVPGGLGFDLGSLSSVGLTSMELYRGGAGAIFGAGALTGALNLTIEPPRRFLGTRLMLAQSMGSFGYWRTAAQGVVAPSKHSAATFAAQYRQAEGDFPFVDRQGKADTRVNNDHRNVQVLGATRWRKGPNQWRVHALFNQGSMGVPGPSEFQRRFAGARLSQRRLMTGVSWSRRDALRGDWGAMDMHFASGIQWQNQLYRNPSAFLGGGPFSNESQAFIAEAQWRTQWYFKDMGFLTAQLELRRESFGQTQLDSDVRLDATRKTGAGALSYEHAWWDNKISLIGVLRVEGVDNQPTIQPNLFLPAIGAMVQVSPMLKLKANVARTARVPDFDELYLNVETVRGDASLTPESAWVIDAGAIAQPHKSLSLEAVIFGQKIDDVILFVPRTAYLVQATNIGEATQYGAELQLAWQPHQRVRVDGGYTWTVAQLDNTLRTPYPNQPEHQASGRMLWSILPKGAWLDRADLMLRWRWRSKIYLDNFARLENNSVHLLGLGLDLGRRAWTMRVDIRNVLDARGVLDGLQRPLPGRRYALAFRYAFDFTP